jgi:hypothetical protein
MKAELSAEEVVTNLISSNEILKSKSYSKNVFSSSDLGNYLNNLPKEDFSFSKNELYDIKYRFIRKCDSWD